MKFICQKQSLYEAISNTSKAVADKSTIPALEGIKLTLDNSVLHLTGYDLEIGIKTQISVKSQDKGELIVNSRLFSDIVKRMPCEEILIDVDNNYFVTISGGETEYKISATSSDDYPNMPEVSESSSINLPQSILKSMINQTIFAVSQNDTKPIFKGELFEFENGTFNLVAIDGHRLAIRTENIKTSENCKFVVPGKALMEVSRLLKDEDEETVNLHVSKKHIIFDISGCLVISRLLEGEFHNFRSSIPQKSSTEVVVSTKELLSCLERASLLINERIKSPIICLFENGEVKLSCSTSIGKINDKVRADITGPVIEIGFNCKYLIEPLKVVSDEKVKLQLSGAQLPMKMIPVNNDSYTFLILPMRFNKSE